MVTQEIHAARIPSQLRSMMPTGTFSGLTRMAPNRPAAIGSGRQQSAVVGRHGQVWSRLFTWWTRRTLLKKGVAAEGTTFGLKGRELASEITCALSMRSGFSDIVWIRAFRSPPTGPPRPSARKGNPPRSRKELCGGSAPQKRPTSSRGGLTSTRALPEKGWDHRRPHRSTQHRYDHGAYS